MSADLQIRTVTVELLRPGPAHNQLLSPLTQYLGICDDAEAGIVTQPYEHHTFMRRMAKLSYDGQTEQTERVAMLREMGAEVGKVLGAVPRLAGSITSDTSGPDTLIHLRMVLSASELSALPFEMAKVPTGQGSVADAWLSLQARTPVVITRRTRNVSAHGVRWPMKPRVLFISADPDTDAVPFEPHREALIDAIRPFCYPGTDDPVLSAEGRREQFGRLLTILKGPRFEEVVAECAATRYTHVHVLAHGVKDDEQEQLAYGLQLGDEVISAERLASAFTGLVDGAQQRPTVVSLATCDSGNVGSVLVPGASIAHVLHRAGIALVVASQVPLSKQGSVLVFREFYARLLWGDSLWPLLHRLRTALHGRMAAQSHDWASLVVYEALPADLDDQLEEARYNQGKAAINAAFELVDRAVANPRADPAAYPRLTRSLAQLVTKLPMDGRYAMECLGLKASTQKRLAQAEYQLALRSADMPLPQARHLEQSCFHLDEALHAYEQAVTGFLVNQGKPLQRVASMHWVLVQQLSLAAVLCRQVPPGTREAAYLAARAYLEHPDPMEQAWAHGSLAELELLELANTSIHETIDVAARQTAACSHAKELVRIARRQGQAFAVSSTRKQFERYVSWWGTALFEQTAMELEGDAQSRRMRLATDQPRPNWTMPAGGESVWQSNGLVRVAAAVAAVLQERATAVAKAAPEPASVPAASTPVSGSIAHHPSHADRGLLAASPATKRATKPAAKPASKRPATQPSGGVADAQRNAFLHIEMLAAGHGDCLWIEYGQGVASHKVLVDCGTASTYAKVLKPRLEQLAPKDRQFELLILSHIDDDHIGGSIPMLSDLKALGLGFGDIWFNGWRHIKGYAGFLGARQGEQFSQLIQTQGLPWNEWLSGKAVVVPRQGPLPTCTLPGGLKLTLLSPSEQKLAELAPVWKKAINALKKKPGDDDFLSGDAASRSTSSTDVHALAAAPFKPDGAQANGSSIAVLIEFAGKRVLLGADAHSPLLLESIERLVGPSAPFVIDAFKLPHHGSQNNLHIDLMRRLACRHYLVSSDGSRFQHPDRQAIGRVIAHGGAAPQLHFNYDSRFNTVWKAAALQQQFGYRAVYPSDPDAPGLKVVI